MAERDLFGSPVHHILLALTIAGSGILAVLAAAVDPWLLVMMIGVAVTTYVIYDRTDPDWYAL